MPLNFLPTGTLLTITPLSGASSLQLTPYSARGLTQTYEVLRAEGENAWLRRDVNAVLQSLVDTRFRKYRTTVTCTDGETPCLDDAWIGQEVSIDCAFEFSYPTSGTPARPVVSGSSRTQGDFTYYRPTLTCLCKDIRVAGFQEYRASYSWQIDFEEK
jgi:hypothetical protein